MLRWVALQLPWREPAASSPQLQSGGRILGQVLKWNKKIIHSDDFFRKELSCLHLPQANQLSVLSSFLFSPVPLSLVHSLRIEETLCFGIFFPVCFLFAYKVVCWWWRTGACFICSFLSSSPVTSLGSNAADSCKH